MPIYFSKSFRFAFNAICLFSLLFLVSASLHRSSAQVLSFESYTAKDGLLSNDILTITQDYDGYLWVTTRDGVSIFDGHRFASLTTANGLPSNPVLQISEDRASRAKLLWLLGANGTLTKWSHGTCLQFHYDSLRSWTHNITSICVDGSGILWAGTEDTLVQIVNDRISPVHVGTRVEFPHLIKEQGDSALWIASRSGLARYSTSTKTFTKIPLGQFEGMIIGAIILNEDGSIWAGAEEGYLLKIERSSIVGWRKIKPFTFLVRDKRGTFWFGNYSGLYRMRDPLSPRSTIEHLTMENGLSENTLREAFVDREGNLWLGGIMKGLVKLADDRLVRFPMGDINPPYQHSIGASDFNNHIWVVARSGLWEFWRTPSNEWQHARHEKLPGKGMASPFPVFDIEPPGNRTIKPYSLFCARDSVLWVVFSNAQLVSYKISPSAQGSSQLRLMRTLVAGKEIPHEFPECMIVDHRGFLWYTVGGKILLLDPGRRKPVVRSFNGVPDSADFSDVRVLFEDRTGSIWAGSVGHEVLRLDADSVLRGFFHPTTATGNMEGDPVTSICQDSLGRIWMGTEGSGVLVGNGKSVTRLSANRGLSSNTILSLTAEQDGRIWLGSSSGISYLDSSASPAAVQPSIFLGEYSVQSGLTLDSTLWFVGRSGVLLYRPGHRTGNSSLPSTRIVSFFANGKPLDIEKDQDLLYNENSCVIGFVAPTFRDPAMVAYQYRLIGLDTSWSTPQRQDRVTFAALPPGRYTFEVRAAILDSPLPSTAAKFQFSIRSPFWKQWWFTLLCWLAVVGIVGGTIRHFEKRKMLTRMRVLELQQMLDRERLRISRDMHDEVGSALTEITYLSELAKTRPEAARRYIQDISDRASEVIDNVSEIVWAMNPHNDTLDNLLAHLRRHAVKYLDLAGIRCIVTAPEVIPAFRIAGQDRRNVFLAVKEGLHNVVKHSRATEVALTIELHNAHVEIRLRDNGSGYPPDLKANPGHGLENMRRRLESIGGQCTIQSDTVHGTQVAIRFAASLTEIT